MAGYIIATLNNVSDPDGFAAYQKAASAYFSQYGAKFILNSRNVETLDGGWAPAGVVVAEFESYDQAKKFYNSPEYQAIIDQRFQTSDSSAVLIDGG
jgi:uncharacterized protein (DUF1330 family)